MGNCLKIDSSDDISLLSGGSSSGGASTGPLPADALNNTNPSNMGCPVDATGTRVNPSRLISTEADFGFDGVYQDAPNTLYSSILTSSPGAATTTTVSGDSVRIGSATTPSHTIATSDNHNIFPCNLSELEQVRLAKRIGLIQHLPIGIYYGSYDDDDDDQDAEDDEDNHLDDNDNDNGDIAGKMTTTNTIQSSPASGTNNTLDKKKTHKKTSRECVICMIEFKLKESIRYLPCMHAYHVRCIDDWLMRSLTCPSCMVPVDAALLVSFET